MKSYHSRLSPSLATPTRRYGCIAIPLARISTNGDRQGLGNLPHDIEKKPRRGESTGSPTITYHSRVNHPIFNTAACSRCMVSTFLELLGL